MVLWRGVAWDDLVPRGGGPCWRGRGLRPGRKRGGAGREAVAAVPVAAEAGAAMSFVWPWQYSFPPFFT